MSPSQEITVFDPSGDILLLLETNDDQSDIIPPAEEAPAEEAPADEAPADSLVLRTDPDNEFSDSKLARSSATSSRDIVMQVSSKHLSLASKVFDDMFQCQRRDDVASQDREPLTIPLQKDDLESLQTLLYIVHGLTRRVSRQVERSQLLQIVVLIDKYEFYEVAEVFTDMWFEFLRPTIPRNLHQDLASWIYICFELRKSEEFNTLTEIAIRETTCGLEDPDGVVPFWIVDEIQSHRRDRLTEFLQTLSRLLELYRGSDRLCHLHPDCDALALGKLTQGLTSIGLYPIPDPSSLNRSIPELFSTVRAMEFSPLCLSSGRSYYSSRHNNSSHLNEELEKSLSSIEDSIQGLNINERSREDEVRT